MKPNKLAPRVIIISLVLIASIWLILPTIRYERGRVLEEKEAASIAEKMKVSYSYVIESLYKDESILRDKLADQNLPSEESNAILASLDKLQGEHRETMGALRKKAIKRGLDLQGGMNLLLEVDLVQLLRNLSRQQDAKLDDLLAKINLVLNDDPQADVNGVISSVFAAEGVKLSQYFGEAGESDATVLALITKQADDAINRSLEILRNRIDQFGVSEPSIQKQGNRRIMLELPGVQDPARARDLIGRTALLEFKLLAEPEKSQNFLTAVDKLLSTRAKTATGSTTDSSNTAKSPSGLDSTKIQDDVDVAATFDSKDTTKTADDETSMESAGTPFSSLLRGVRGDVGVQAENLKAVKSILADRAVQKLVPEGTQFVWSAQPEIGGDSKEYWLLYLVKRDAEITGASLSDAQVDMGGGNTSNVGGAVVSLTMNRDGARKFSRVTGANIDKRLAIVLDNKVYMAPNIRSKIPNGRAIIEGVTSVEEANDLAIVLRAGSLPTSVVIEEERTVGPSLGRDSIQKGITSAIIGLVGVFIFMIFYYGLSGLIACIALVLNIILIFSGLAMFGAIGMGATLSLPGIAGMVLTIGMSVDANVLIFERIREELENGKSVYHAIAAGYDRAFSAIFDSNLTTLFSSLVLLQFGSGPIKGFAVTLSIGIACSMFTAIVVTRVIYDLAYTKYNFKRISI